MLGGAGVVWVWISAGTGFGVDDMCSLAGKKWLLSCLARLLIYYPVCFVIVNPGRKCHEYRKPVLSTTG